MNVRSYEVSGMMPDSFRRTASCDTFSTTSSQTGLPTNSSAS